MINAAHCTAGLESIASIICCSVAACTESTAWLCKRSLSEPAVPHAAAKRTAAASHPLHSHPSTELNVPKLSRERSRNPRESGDKAEYAAAQVFSRTAMQDQERHIARPAGAHKLEAVLHCSCHATHTLI